jgi:hypothetical protein
MDNPADTWAVTDFDMAFLAQIGAYESWFDWTTWGENYRRKLAQDGQLGPRFNPSEPLIPKF